MKIVRIPFDSLVLAAVVVELRPFLGGRVQGIRQPNEAEIVLELYAAGREGMFLFNVHADFFRAHFITRRPGNTPSPLQFCSALRARIGGASLIDVEQPPNERILVLTFESSEGVFRLIAELMGKHSNVILVNEKGEIVAAAKWLPPTKSSRPIQPGRPYFLPPTLADPHGSKFFRKLLEANFGQMPPQGTVLAAGFGAYPVSVEALGIYAVSRSSMSVALEQHFAEAILRHAIDSARTSLVAQLDRAILAREVSVNDLREAIESGSRAARWQLYGELILAYGAGFYEGQDQLDAHDYSGNAVQVPIDPNIGFKENASAYFQRARRAKERIPYVRVQLARAESELTQLTQLRLEVFEATNIEKISDLQDIARRNRWLRTQTNSNSSGIAKPAYEGHKIREFAAPKGSVVLVGENSESNDYLTMRVAKSDDLWLHVRGHTSGHVVIPTQRHPERIAREDLIFAAQVAVMHSNQKHGSYVPVDYTLKKFVRKPRGSAKGSVVYTNEKTLYVDPIKR